METTTLGHSGRSAPWLPGRFSIVRGLCEGGRVLLGGTGGGRQTLKEPGMRLSFSHFLSISPSGPPVAGGSALISHLGLVRVSPAFYFTWPGTTFGFTVQPINFLSVTSCRSGLGGSVQACVRSSSIQLTHIELLLRARSSSGHQRGEGQASERGKPRSKVLAFPERASAEPEPRPQLHFVKLAGREVRAPRPGALTPWLKVTPFGGSMVSFDSGKGVLTTNRMMQTR